MNWGSLLLGLGDGFASLLVWLSYNVTNLFNKLLMLIWTGLAWIVDGVESVFRNLAGLRDDGTVNDMASAIIKHEMVWNIFSNLVALSAALLIFFTIVKIIQQQYKEKQGGNPYIIVFRMFKGMMMFFFVSGAVLVGLYASSVVFRALDDATKSGTYSVSGQVFRSMAADANRKRIGAPEDITWGGVDTQESIYYYRVTDNPKYNLVNPKEQQKYTMVEMKGDAVTTQAQAQAWYDSMSSNHWGVVNADGSVLPLKAALSKDDYNTGNGKSEWDMSGVGNYNTGSYGEFESGDGDAHGSFGYQNDILSSFDTFIQPAIDVEWSPISIQETTYALEKTDAVVPTNIFVTVLGSGTDIPAGFKTAHFAVKQPYTKLAISENNMFSINMHGRAALQGSEIGASFDLDTYATEMPVDKIMATILTNNLLIKMLEKYLVQIPDFKAWVYVGPVSLNLISVAQTIAGPIFTAMLNGLLYSLTAGAVESADEFIELSNNDDLAVTWRKYDLGDKNNWEDLWSQVASSYEDLKDQILSQFDKDSLEMDTAMKEVDKLVGELDKQQAWVKYKLLVDGYNDTVEDLIINLIEDADTYADTGYTVNYTAEERKEIENRIKDNWETLVFEYLKFDAASRNAKRPTQYRASTEVVGKIYKPIFETSSGRGDAAKLSADQIVEMLKSGSDCSFNLIKNPVGGNGYTFRVVDWDCYADEVKYYANGSRLADVFEGTWTELPHILSTCFEPQNFELGINFVNNRNIVQDDLFSTRSDFGTNPNLYSTSNLRTTSVAADDAPTTYRDWCLANGVDYNGGAAVATPQYSSSAEQQAAGEALWQSMVAKAQAANTNTEKNYVGTYAGRDLITFRYLGDDLNTAETTPAEKKDVTTLAEWMSTSRKLKIADGATISAVPLMTADNIDYYMCDRTSHRRYLLLSDNRDGGYTKAENQTGYVGRMTYTDMSTLNALYELHKMNFVIGYIGIIVALGVYMNFTFGLIQRAVNLAVLYMMSPLTIAFYPFDDGQRFKGQFITPFYKEAISAYAVILSLNIFLLLATPVQTAVTNAAGSFMGIIALIAFTSMLPKIRDSITSMLGAGNMASKSLTDMFKDAGNTLADPFKQMNTLRKMPVESARSGYKKLKGARDFLRGVSDRQARDKALKARLLEDKLRDGAKLNKKEQSFLDRYKNKEKAIKDKQDKINAAIAAGQNSDTWKNLSKSEQNMAKRQIKEAKRKAMEETENGTLGEAFLKDQIKNGATPEIRAAAKKQLAALQNLQKQKGNEKKTIDQLAREQREKELLNDSAFLKSVNGVTTSKKLGKALQDKFQHTLVGNVAETLFHPATGMLVNDPNSIIGDMVKWHSKVEQKKRLDRMYWQEKEYADVERDVKATKFKDAMGTGGFMIDAENAGKDTIKKNAAAKQAREQVNAAFAGGVDRNSKQFKEAYLAAAKRRNMKQLGYTEAEAKASAEREFKQLSNAQLKTEWKKMATEDFKADWQKSLQDDLVRGVGGAKIDDKYLAAATADFEAIKKMDPEQLRTYKKELSAEKQASVKSMVDNLAKKLNLSPDAVKGLDKKVIDAVGAGDSIDTITGKIMGHLPAGSVSEAAVKQQLGSSGFNANIAKMKFELDSEASMVSGALTYNKKIEKAQESLRETLNMDLNDPKWQNFYNSVYRKMYDPNMKGGLIEAENNLVMKYHGDTSSAAYKQERAAIVNKYSAEFDNALERLGNNTEVFQRDYSVKRLQIEEADRGLLLGKEANKRINYHVDNNMSKEAQDLMLSDSGLRKLKAEGDYVKADLLLKDAVNAAIRKDWAALDAMDMDETSKRQFKDWSNAGESGLKELDSLVKLSDLHRQFFGSADGTAANNDIARVKDAMTGIYGVYTDKNEMQMARRIADQFATEANSYRKAIGQFRNQASEKFKGSTWQKAIEIMNLQKPNGEPITSQKQLTKYIDDMLDRMDHKVLSMNDAEVQRLLNSFNTLKGEWGTHPELKAMQGTQAAADFNAVTDAFNQMDIINQNESKSARLKNVESEIGQRSWESRQKVEKETKKG